MEANTGTLLTAVTNQEVQALSSRVMDPGRVHPIVVVSDSNELDAEHIAHALRLRCDVYQVPAKRLIDVVPARWGALSMSGCTARVFPGRDLDWRTRPDLSRFFRAGANAEDVIAAARNVVPGLAARNQASRRAAADRALSREAPQHVVWLREVHGAHALAQRLLDQSRTNPCAVVTVPFGATEPTIDAEALLAVAPGEVEVFVLPTREMTFVLTDTLGREASVFGGAGRVYPPGVAWLHDRTLAPLHLVDTYTRSQAATDRMIADVIREVGRVRVASHHSRDHHQSHSTSAAPTRPRSPLQEYIPGAVVLARVAQVTLTRPPSSSTPRPPLTLRSPTSPATPLTVSMTSLRLTKSSLSGSSSAQNTMGSNGACRCWTWTTTSPRYPHRRFATTGKRGLHSKTTKSSRGSLSRKRPLRMNNRCPLREHRFQVPDPRMSSNCSTKSRTSLLIEITGGERHRSGRPMLACTTHRPALEAKSSRRCVPVLVRSAFANKPKHARSPSPTLKSEAPWV